MVGALVPLSVVAVGAGVVALRRPPVRLADVRIGHAEGLAGVRPALIAEAAPCVPLAICGRVTRVSILPDDGWMLVTVTDGSAEAALAFRRDEAPSLPTGSYLVADGMFARADVSPRSFDAAMVTLVDAELRTRSVYRKDAP